MKTFKEYLKEAQQINYDLHDIRVIRKRNIEAARDILQNNKEIINDINNAKNVSQFDTEEQRDAVVAAYILTKEQPEYAQKIGIDIQNPKNFEMMVKDEIIDPTRTAAKETGKKNPTMQEVKNAGQPKPTEKEQEQDDKERADLKAAVAKPSEEPEEPEEPKEKGEEPAQDSEEQDDEETPRGDSDSELDKVSPVDKEEFPPPKEIAKEIENMKKEALQQLDTIGQDDPTQGQQRIIDNAKNDINNKLNSFIKTADKADRAYSVNPTPMSMRRGSTNAKKALNDAEAIIQKAISKAKRKQLDTGIERGVKRVAELGKAGVEKVKKAAQSRPAQILKQEGGRALKQTGSAIKRGAEQAKAATERVVSNIAQNTTAKMISNQLGTKRAQEYIQYLRNNENEKAEALRQEALKRAGQDKREERFNRMDQRVQGNQNKALRQASSGKGGSRAAAVAKRVTDKFRGSSSGSSEERRQA